MISLFNHGSEPMEIRAGDKVAQMIIQPVFDAPIAVVEDLSESERGSRGINDTDLRLRD
jgi:dUTP pyrophosphatase